jgi:tetratricopeptide (TPR) repeat protein
VDDLHPSRALLTGYFRDELPSPRRRKISGHVALCPVCQRRLSQLERETETAAGAVDYESAFLRAAETVRSLKESIDEEARCSVSLLPELLKESPERRFERIAGEPRFHALKLCQLLQDRSRSDWFEEPARGLESARLAVAIADHLDEGRYGSGLVAEERARAWALLGNAWRITRNLHNAEQALNQAARYHLLTRDPLVESEILGLTASLRCAQDRTEESIALLDRAVAISREIGDRLREGRALILKGKALGDTGRHREALRILRKARLRVTSAVDPELALTALHNLLIYLVEAGRPLEAEQLLRSERHRYIDLGHSRFLARLLWLEALIAKSLGRLEEATPLLWKAREAFYEHQIPLDWSLASFRLAEVLARQGSRAEARRLLEELIPVLDFMEVQPEAGAARMIYLWCRRS